MMEIRAKMTLGITSLLIGMTFWLALGAVRQTHFGYPCVQGMQVVNTTGLTSQVFLTCFFVLFCFNR